jgi:hypothetical protein
MSESNKLASKFERALSAARKICASSATRQIGSPPKTRSPLRLIQMAQKRSQSGPKKRRAAIRTIHHLSCTGGTLIVKCIAAMPNTVVLNEFAPNSSILESTEGYDRFTPTDVISLLKQGHHTIEKGLIAKVATSNIEIIADDQHFAGRRIVFRDHSHSDFLFGPVDANPQTLTDLIPDRFDVHSVTTVRHPLDSYLSMIEQGWHQHFSPPTLREYARRYLLFLEKYKGLQLFKYEEFVASPAEQMQSICEALALPFNENFEQTFGYFKLSGDSGRSSGRITSRARRKPSFELSSDLKSDLESSEYQALCQKLNYRSNP